MLMFCIKNQFKFCASVRRVSSINDRDIKIRLPVWVLIRIISTFQNKIVVDEQVSRLEYPIMISSMFIRAQCTHKHRQKYEFNCHLNVSKICYLCINARVTRS